MKTQEVINEIKLNLSATSGMKTKIELNEKDLQAVVSSSLRQLTTFMGTPKMITVPYSDIIDLKEHKIASVSHVMRAEAPAGVLQGVSLDPFYLSGAVGITQPGSPTTHNIFQTQIQYAIRAMAQNTIQDDLTFIVDEYNKKLMVTYAGMRPNQITILFKPIIETVEDLPNDYWVTYLIRLATAHAKIIIGQIRAKYQQSAAPISVGGDMLGQGIKELEDVRAELKTTRSAVFD